jgi:DNA primase
MTAVEQIKDKVDIVEHIGSCVTLTKSGINYKGKCPFHNEKTPSFIVSPERQSFYCFGCGVGGDIFTFVEKYEGLDFKEALKTLADKTGVQLDNNYSGVPSDEKEELYKVCEEACKFFQKELQVTKDALSYLEERGVNSQTIETFRLGFAPSSWTNLNDYLVSLGYSKDLILKAGLAKQKEDRYYDTFRSRIIFPFFDSTGRVIAFSGRIFNEESEAKYLNSPETPIFTKGQVLYGFDKAKSEIRRLNYSVMVEGQIDLILSHQFGHRNTVASSGTAVSERALISLGRLSKNLLLILDGDSAGISASGRVAKIALPMGFNLKSAILPKGMDPADLLTKTPEKWADIVKKAVHIVDFYLNFLENAKFEKRKFNLEVVRIVLPYVAIIENNLDQSYFVKRIAEKTNASEESVWLEIAKIEVKMPVEKSMVIKEEVNVADLKTRIARLIKYTESIDKKNIAEKLLEGYTNITNTPPEIVDLEEREVFEMDNSLHDADLDKISDEILNRFHIEYLENQLREASNKLKQSELQNDDDEVKVYITKCHDLSSRINDLKVL